MRPKSKKPRKQRKYNFLTPLSENHKLMSANLSPEIRASQGFRSLPVVKGDQVTIMRGKYKGRSGKVSRTDPQKQRVFIDKVKRGKSDQSEIPVAIHPSNLVITKFHRKDKFRRIIINRRTKEEDAKIDLDAVLDEDLEEDVIEFEDELLDEELEEDLDDELVEIKDESPEGEETEEDDVN